MLLSGILLVFCMQGPACAVEDMEIGNLVLNKTITRVGNEFYEAFADRWIPPRNLGILHVMILEAPSARWGSIIGVRVGDTPYFRTRISSRSRNIEEIAEQAVTQVLVTLMRQSLQRQNDDGKGDLYGDGL